jgi:hypothetical protein
MSTGSVIAVLGPKRVRTSSMTFDWLSLTRAYLAFAPPRGKSE